MINIIINLSGKSENLYENYIKKHPKDKNNFFYVYTPYDIIDNVKIKIIKTPMNNCLATLMNNIFWIINQSIYYSKDIQEIEKIIIYHNQEILNSFVKNIENQQKNIEIEKNYLIINDKKLLEIPTTSFYNINILFKQNLFLEVWLYLLKEISNINFNFEIPNTFIIMCKNDKNIQNILKKKNENTLYINGGNEGSLFYKDANKQQIIKKISKEKTLTSLYKKNKVIYFPEGVENFYHKDTLSIKISKRREFSYIEYEYENCILPCASINFPQAARLAILQRKKNIFIDDNKIINFGKIKKTIPHLSSYPEIFEIIYNDYGSSFIKTENKEFQLELLRDLYYLIKNQDRIDCREIIRSKRYIDIKLLIREKPRLYSFINFVKKEYKDNLPMPCHDLKVRDNIDKYNVIATCTERSTMSRLMSKQKNKNFCYDQKLNKLFECNLDYIPPGFEKSGAIDELSKHLELIQGSKKWIKK